MCTVVVEATFQNLAYLFQFYIRIPKTKTPRGQSCKHQTYMKPEFATIDHNPNSWGSLPAVVDKHGEAEISAEEALSTVDYAVDEF